MAAVQTLFTRLKQKQSSKRSLKLNLSSDDLDLPKLKALDTDTKWQNDKTQRELPPLPVSPTLESLSHHVSSCENIYEEISEEFLKEIIRRKPAQMSNALSNQEDDYGFTKKLDSSTRKRVAKNIRGMLTFSKTKLFSPKDELPEQCDSKRKDVEEDSALAIRPDVMYSIDAASTKGKQVCRCTHQHPEPCVPALRLGNHVPPQQHQPCRQGISQPVEQFSNASQLSYQNNGLLPHQAQGLVNAMPLGVNYQQQVQQDQSHMSRPQNRNSCTDSVTPYFGAGSDSGVSCSSEGSYGNASQLSPMGYQGYNNFRYNDHVFQNSSMSVASTVPVNTMTMANSASQPRVVPAPPNPAASFSGGPGPYQAQTFNHAPLSPSIYYRDTLYPAQATVNSNNVLNTSVAASETDSKLDYLKPTCEHLPGNQPLAAVRDEGFSEPQESNFVKRAREKIYQKLKHLDLAELEGRGGRLDFGISPLIWDSTSTGQFAINQLQVPMSPPLDLDDPTDFASSAFRPYIAEKGNLEVTYDPAQYLPNPHVPNPPAHQQYVNGTMGHPAAAHHPYTQQGAQYQNQSHTLVHQNPEVFTSISLRKGLQSIDTGTLSPVKDIPAPFQHIVPQVASQAQDSPPPPVPQRCPQRISTKSHRPLPEVPVPADSCDKEAKDNILSQNFNRSKSLMSGPSDDKILRSDSPEFSPNFHRKGLRKAIHGRRSVSSDYSSTDQSDCEFVNKRASSSSAKFHRVRLSLSQDSRVKVEAAKTETELSNTKDATTKTNVDKHNQTKADTKPHSRKGSKNSISKESLPKSSESSAGTKDKTVSHNVPKQAADHNVPKQAFKPVPSKRRSMTPPADSGSRLGVRVNAMSASPQTGAVKAAGQSSALTDLLRRNHDRQLLVFV